MRYKVTVVLRLQAQFYSDLISHKVSETFSEDFVVVVALLFYVHGKHLRSCQDGHLT